MRLLTFHLPLSAIAALAATAMCLSAAPAAAKTKPAQPLYWGAQIGDQLTGEQPPWDMGAVDKFEQMVGKRMSVLSFSAPFAECDDVRCHYLNFPTTPMENVRVHGAIPLFSWSSMASPEEESDQHPYRLSKIIDGSLDPYLLRFAESADAWGHPFFMRFDWEMNGFWFPWSEGLNGNKSGEFVRAWRHVHRLFDAAGATNVSWVWCPNIDFTRELIPLHSVYPGNAYVDWTCLDGFNWGKRSDSAGWQSFNEVFRSTYKRIVRIAPKKPMVIAEVASNEKGGSKSEWIRNMLRIVPRKYRKIRGLVWFDVLDRGTNWPIESSRKSIRAFAQGIKPAVYRPNIFGQIGTSPIAPPIWP